MDGQLDFAVTVNMNPYLTRDAATLHAILDVTAAGQPIGAAPVPAAVVPGRARTAVVILLDCSGSMADPIKAAVVHARDNPSKIGAAQQATVAAIDALRDGDLFAVIAGRHDAAMVYPQVPVLEEVSAHTRRAAREKVSRVKAEGGTAMGRWLMLARDLLANQPSTVRHAILLTDGKNESEGKESLEQALTACSGQFVCDARGIGDLWNAQLLLRIATRLRGRAEAVRAAGDLVADFEMMTAVAMAKVVPDMVLQIRVTAPARLRFVKQVFPLVQDLTEDTRWPTEHVAEVSTGSWQAESRHYHLCLDLTDLDRLDESVCVARLETRVRGEKAGDRIPVVVHWTGDSTRASQVNEVLANYTGQEALSQVVIDGCVAYDRQDLAAAQTKFAEAVRLAWASGNDDQLARLRRLVDIVDPATGEVRLRGGIPRADLLAAEVGSQVSRVSTLTASASGPVVATRGQGEPSGHQPDRVCRCGRVSPHSHRLCPACGAPFDDVDGAAPTPVASA
jgi:hypothetical protein